MLLYSTQYCYYTTYSTVIIQHTVLLLYNIQYTVLLLYSTQYCYYTAYSTVIIQHTVLLLYSIQYYYYTAYNTVIIQHTVLLLYSIQYCYYTVALTGATTAALNIDGTSPEFLASLLFCDVWVKPVIGFDRVSIAILTKTSFYCKTSNSNDI